MSMFNFKRGEEGTAKGPRGYRAYAIGDVHGRLDLLERLLADIERDRIENPARKVLLVFLGDLIDRGPQSAQVIERLRSISIPNVRAVFLLGNHEEVLLRILDGDLSLIPSWLRFGGAECLQSYGVDWKAISRKSDAEAIAAVRGAIPVKHVEFLRSFADTC